MNAEDPAPIPLPPSARILVPYHQDPLSALARLILDRYQQQLPDLTGCVALLSQPLDAPRLRRALLDGAVARGHRSLLGPIMSSLRHWLDELAPPPAPPLSPQARELILIETLNRHRSLFKDSDPWLLAANLLELFDQLTLHRVTLSAEIDVFIKRLRKAYQLAEHSPAALSMEANLVHTLWHAWHRQLQEEGLLDPQAAYIAQLEASLAALDPDLHIFLAGLPAPSPSEQRWIETLIARGQLTLVIPGEAEGQIPAEPYTRYLNEVFAGMQAGTPHAPFKERAQSFAADQSASPAAGRLFVHAAPSAEAEACGIDIQVRRWLLQGKQHIAVVSDDRRLARRVRALLERADVDLFDAAGWALSTTAAAAALERWLECVEEDFAYHSLTDLLKSPFIFPHQNRDELLQAVYRFEQDLVLHENVPRSLQRYRTHLAYRRSRWPQAVGTTVQALLDDIGDAAQPLLPLVLSRRPQSPHRWLDALEASLQRLGLAESFGRDAAGGRILQELQVMRQALTGRHISMAWREFRTWLGRTLERYNFQPPGGTAAVQLLSLDQSGLTHYDAVIIAGATAQHLPGAGQTSPFFNEAVRRELGLPGFQEYRDLRFRRFRRLLQAAPQVLITVHREEKGEALLPSPWLEALRSFHRFSSGIDVNDAGLGGLVDDPRSQVIRGDGALPPLPKSMPAPVVSPGLLPHKLSANAYQQLVNCPYQFFAARCLQLTAPEEVREALEKSDYGQRIHLALQAFHGGAEGLPGPFDQALTAANRNAAIRCLQDISQAVFAKDLEDNFMHRGWLQRWRQIMPLYIDWEIERAGNWRVTETEAAVERPYGGFSLKGRIDRIDSGKDGAGIVDYKTGTTPHQNEVMGGEQVQLPFYVLLADRPVRQVEYLSLDGNRVGSRAVLDGDELNELAKQNGERLLAIMDEMAKGAPLPAWGDAHACEYCMMAGVCRRAAWIDVAPPANPQKP
ncbi:MAG: PD-(D/E)XK nuclease family protein [Gammaproteobacteria bacterium]